MFSERLRQRPTSIQSVKDDDGWFDEEEQDSGIEVDSDDPDYTITESNTNLRRVNVINNSVAENLDREKISVLMALSVLLPMPSALT